jgi:fermentation-respiration switch protein FrsA (DUF1100 family)
MKRVRKKILSMIWLLLAGVGLLYFGVLAIMYFLQPGMVYFPTREMEATPAQIGLAYEEIEFPAADAVRLHGWFIPAEPARATILFCHGNGGNISHRLESIRIFHDLGLSIFIFDYRGYGASDGKPGEDGTYHDALGAWKYLTEKRGIAADQIVLFGRSLGGAVAAWLATKTTPRALIMESSFTSIPDVAARLYPFLPVRLLSRFHYPAKEYIKNLSLPILIVHSPDDDIIPFEHGRELFASAREPKQFLEIRGSHNDGFLVSGNEYRLGLDSFLNRFVD